MKLILNKLIILFIFSVAPFAWADMENIRSIIASNQIKITEPFNVLYPPFHVEFKGKTGIVFIGNYGKKAGEEKGIYFLTNNGNELHYIDDVYFEEILGIFKFDFILSGSSNIIIFGRNKEDNDIRHGFDYKFMETKLKYQNNHLSLTYTPILAFERWGGCFEGISVKEQLTCTSKDEKGLRAALNKMYNPKLITNLATIDISKKDYFVYIKTPKTYLYSSPMEKSKTKMYLVKSDKASLENIKYDKGLAWLFIKYQTSDSKLINKWLKAKDVKIYHSEE